MLHLELDGTGARYEQLARALKQAILLGRLKVGTRLPPTRELATQLRVSRNTVLTAYEILCTEQFAHARAGSGTFVSDRSQAGAASRDLPEVPPQSRYAARLRQLPPTALRRPSPPLRYNLQYGEPLVDLALFNTWRKELSQAASVAELTYPAAQGVPVLREAICDHLGRRRGLLCEPDDVVIVSGTQQAVALLARILVDEGDEVVLEDPHYQMAAHALQAHGARLLSVPTDAEGLVCDALPARAVRLVLVTPSHQFPSGVEMSVARRLALLRYAQRHGSWIVEDDYDGEFRYAPQPTPALRALDGGAQIIYVGTFSKVVFPGLRLGYVIVPRSLRRDLVAAKRLDDMGCGVIEQLAMARFMTNGGFDRHLRKASAELRRRRAALIDGLARHAGGQLRVTDSVAGMHCVGWLPGWPAVRVERLLDLARARGLGLHPIAPHYAQPPRTPGLLLGFAALSVPQLKLATALLGRCLAEAAAVDGARPGALRGPQRSVRIGP